MQKKIDDLLARLESVKQTSNNKWIAICPAHADKRPSLGIKLDHDRILINCWAGCGALDILNAIGYSDYSALFPDVARSKNTDLSFSKSEFFDSAIAEASILEHALHDVLKGIEINKQNWERVLVAIRKIEYMKSETTKLSKIPSWANK